jgi:nitrogen-specific signal transduction histidine kinase
VARSIERERLQRVAAQLKTLYHMGRDLGEDENWSDALDRFLMALVNFMGASGSGLLLFSDRERSLSARAIFHMDDGLVARAIETIRTGWKQHARGSEIHCLESYGTKRPTSCLERSAPWCLTIIPLRHRGRGLGFLVLDKAYADGVDFQWDYHFLSTLQTIFAEEIASASYVSELRQLSRFNNKVLDNIRSGVVTTDLEGRVRYANAWAGDLCPRLATMGREAVHFDDLFRPAQEAEGLFRPFLAANTDSLLVEVECHGGRETPFPARLRLARMHDDLVNGTVVVGIFDDLSEHKRMEEAIRRNDRLRALGQLSAGVAHEIRNPLAGIATTAEVLADKLGGDDERVKYIRAMLDEITRLDGIVRNLLAFARPPRPQIAPCAVEEILAKVRALVGEQAASRGVELHIDVEGAAAARCLADAAQLTQVLLNLTLNAVQACGEGERVSVVARPESALGRRWVTIEVTDTGAGVASEVRETLFDPFVTTRTQGTGLGLAISRQIVEDHDGRIACEFLERGTRFTVRLPAHAGVATRAR